MNFKTFLIEGKDSKILVEKIKSNCSKFLKESKGNLLFRGLDLKSDFEKVKVRKKRKPTDTPYYIQKSFNKEFEKAKKVKDIRNKATFVVGSVATASRYGSVNVIFPIGDYTYWWSPKVTDLYDYYGVIDAKYELDSDESETKIKKYLFDKIIPTYINKDLVLGIKSKHEIMLLCDYYYAIDFDFFKELNLKEKIYGL